MRFPMKTEFSCSPIMPGRQIHGLKMHSLVFRRFRTLESADLRMIAQGTEQHRGPTAMKPTHEDKTVLSEVLLFHDVQADAFVSLTRRRSLVRFSFSTHHKTPR